MRIRASTGRIRCVGRHMEMSDRMVRLVVKVVFLSDNDYLPPLFSYSVASVSQMYFTRLRILKQYIGHLVMGHARASGKHLHL